MSIAILTDSNSGLSPDTAKALGVFLMPMPVIIDGETYFEGTTIQEPEFFDRLTCGCAVSTSQPSPGDVLALWDELLADHESLVYIPMSSGLSQSCATAKGLASDYEGRVQVVDNHRISVTLRTSVVTAKQMADSGATAEEIRAFLEQDAYRASIYLAVDTLEYLKKGGRVTPAAAAVATVLNLKPVLTIQGGLLESHSKVRGMKHCPKVMIESLKRDIATRFADCDPAQLRVGATGSCLTPEQAEEWRAQLAEAFPDTEVFYEPLGFSICCHTGPGALGVGICYA